MRIAFVDEYTPDERSIDSAAAALDREAAVAVRWPARTAELLAHKVAGRETIRSDLEARRTDDLARGVKRFFDAIDSAIRYAAAAERLPQLWGALANAGASATEARLALALFVRIANLHALASLADIELTGEEPPLEEELRLWPRWDLYNSRPGLCAFGIEGPIYAAEVGREHSSSTRVYGPSSLIKELRVGDTVADELLTRWTIPQRELELLGEDIESDYDGLIVLRVFVEHPEA